MPSFAVLFRSKCYVRKRFVYFDPNICNILIPLLNRKQGQVSNFGASFRSKKAQKFSNLELNFVFVIELFIQQHIWQTHGIFMFHSIKRANSHGKKFLFKSECLKLYTKQNHSKYLTE